jgi:hypothetical protein
VRESTVLLVEIKTVSSSLNTAQKHYMQYTILCVYACFRVRGWLLKTTLRKWEPMSTSMLAKKRLPLMALCLSLSPISNLVLVYTAFSSVRWACQHTVSDNGPTKNKALGMSKQELIKCTAGASTHRSNLLAEIASMSTKSFRPRNFDNRRSIAGVKRLSSPNPLLARNTSPRTRGKLSPISSTSQTIR